MCMCRRHCAHVWLGSGIGLVHAGWLTHGVGRVWQVVRAMLENVGHTVEVATNGLEGVEVWQVRVRARGKFALLCLSTEPSPSSRTASSSQLCPSALAAGAKLSRAIRLDLNGLQHASDGWV